MAHTMFYVGICSEGLGGARSCLDMLAVVLLLTFLLLSRERVLLHVVNARHL